MTLLPFEWVVAPGERLPAGRVLADDLQVSRWVVTEAYEQLTAEGHLTSRTGSGTTVAATHRLGPVGRAGGPPRPAAPPGPAADADLSPNLPDLRSFPRATWKAALRQTVDGMSVGDLGYPDPLGDPELRRTGQRPSASWATTGPVRPRSSSAPSRGSSRTAATTATCAGCGGATGRAGPGSSRRWPGPHRTSGSPAWTRACTSVLVG